MGRPAVAARLVTTTVVGALVLGLVVAPLAALVLVMLAGGQLHASLNAPGLGTAVAHSLAVAAGAAALALPGGTAVALALRTGRVPGAQWLRGAILAPLLVPQFVLGYSWTTAYGPAGLTRALAGVTMPGLFGPAGVVVVTAVTVLPLVHLIVAAGLAVRDEPDLVRAARAAGATAVGTLRTVTLPLVRVPVAAAGIVAFVSALESFAVPAVLGTPAGFSTVTTRIYRDLALASQPAAFTDAMTLSLLLVVVAVIGVAPADLLLGPDRRATPFGPAGGWRVRRPGPAGRAIAVALWSYLTVAVAIPLLALVLGALTPTAGVSPRPANWTLANLRTALTGPTLPALAHTLELAVATASALVAMGALVAAIGRRPTGRLLGTVVTLAFALPGSAVAVGVTIAYGRLLGGTLLIILLAYLAKLWPLGHRPLAGAVGRLPGGELRAARVSGAGPVATAWTVVGPALAPALAAGWILVFLVVLHELTMSSLLYGPDTQTVGVVVLNQQQLGDVGATAAVAVVLAGLSAVVAVPALVWWWRRRRTEIRDGLPR